jgi:hypothetical protein
MKSQTKAIRAAIKNGDDTKVKVSFYNGTFTPEEFTAVIMGLIETYTEGLLEKNAKEDVYDHWNRVFGIFLAKILPPKDIYSRDPSHKELKDLADDTLGRPEDPKDTEDNRFAAYLLARDILIKDVGLDEKSADILLNERLGLVAPDPHEA